MSLLVFTDLLFWEVTSRLWEIIAKIIMVLASWIYGIACFFHLLSLSKTESIWNTELIRSIKVWKLTWLSNLKSLENWEWLVSFCLTFIGVRLTEQAKPIEVDNIEQVQCTDSQPSSSMNVHCFQKCRQINVDRTNIWACLWFMNGHGFKLMLWKPKQPICYDSSQSAASGQSRVELKAFTQSNLSCR